MSARVLVKRTGPYQVEVGVATIEGFKSTAFRTLPEAAALFDAAPQLQQLVQEYLDWHDRKDERECLAGIVERMRAALQASRTP